MRHSFGRRLWPGVLVAASAALGALAFAPAAQAAPNDAIASGAVTLDLSKAFSKQLKRNGVKMSRREFNVKRGSLDPTEGTGSLTLDGKLRFKKGKRKLVLRKLSATLGPKGVIRGDGIKLFGLSGGQLTRDAFGADITGIQVKFLRKGARNLNRKLKLRSLHRGNAGTAAVSEQPRTVRATGGSMTIVPSLDTSAVAGKLPFHCVNPVTGVTAISPAQKDIESHFTFPVAGGTVAPGGREGLTLFAGGSQIAKEPLNIIGACGAVSSDTTIRQTDLQVDLQTNFVFATAAVAGYPPPLGGPKGVAIAFNINRANSSIDAQPKDKRIVVKGLVLTLSEASATFLNLVFPNNSGDAARNFRAGDLFGTASMTVRTR